MKNITMIAAVGRNLELGKDNDLIWHFKEDMKFFRDQTMVIGGASVYQQMLDYSDKLILTEIDAEAECDVYFPSFNKEEWNREEVGEEQREGDISYKHLVYTRKKVR